MPFWPLLLRVLLCVALVLNGTNAAMAGVTTDHQMAGVVVSVTGPGPGPASVHGCHDEAPEAAVDHAQETQKPGASQHPAPDCCEQSACACACVQAAQALLPPMALASSVPNGVRLPPPSTVRHAEPALPHLIRPPIG